MAAMKNKNAVLSDLREREATHQEYIRRNPRFSSAEKSELEDIQQEIRKLQKGGVPPEDDEGEDGIVY
jgi:hypothetical protein